MRVSGLLADLKPETLQLASPATYVKGSMQIDVCMEDERAWLVITWITIHLLNLRH